VVTSRSQLTGLAAAEGAQLLTLDVLTRAESRDLLAGRLGYERVAAEPAAVTELTGLCAGLPLALAIAAARAAARPGLRLAALAAELRGTQSRLDGLSTGDPATDVRTVFSWSCQQLSEPAARMFRLLGLHPGPDITAAAAASLAGVPPGHARQTLAELARAHLITEHAPGRYACHDLLRAYAAEQAASHDSDAARRAAVHRMLDHYLHTASAASILLHSDRSPVTLSCPQPLVRPEELADREQALAWFRAERQVLLAAISQALRLYRAAGLRSMEANLSPARKLAPAPTNWMAGAVRPIASATIPSSEIELPTMVRRLDDTGAPTATSAIAATGGMRTACRAGLMAETTVTPTPTKSPTMMVRAWSTKPIRSRRIRVSAASSSARTIALPLSVDLDEVHGAGGRRRGLCRHARVCPISCWHQRLTSL
jgi:hypothetical protein